MNDLAGSEDVEKAGGGKEQQKEAICINKSLCALNDVIYALNNRASHVPYRNSILTLLLQERLKISWEASTITT